MTERDDPFEGLVLDEEFVRAARRAEESGDARARRAAEARQAHQRLRKEQHRAHRSERRRRVIRVVRVVLVVGLVAGACAFAASRLGRSSASAAAIDLFHPGLVTNRPTSRPPESPRRLEGAISTPANGGPYTFFDTQPGSDDPVTYDPCRTIEIVVNDRTAPEGADLVLDEALRHVTQVTGLRFHVEGPTDEAPVEQRPPFQPERYGDRWAPVLVAWTDQFEVRHLAGNIAGLGGSSSVSGSDGLTYVSGIVYLDGPTMGPFDDSAQLQRTRAVLLHELGHLVGLDHTDGQLMDAHGHAGIVDFQSGDLAGLARLGQGPCRDAL